MWALTIELNDRQSFPFLMAIVRDGTAVSQLGFAPDRNMTMSRADFVALSRRVMERLASLRARGLTQPFRPLGCLTWHEASAHRSSPPPWPALLRARRLRRPGPARRDDRGGSTAPRTASPERTPPRRPATAIPDDFPLSAGMGGPSDTIATSRSGTGLRDLRCAALRPLRGLGTA